MQQGQARASVAPGAARCLLSHQIPCAAPRRTRRAAALSGSPGRSRYSIVSGTILRASRGGHGSTSKVMYMHCTALTLNRYRHRGGLSSRGRLCPVQRLHPPRAGRARVHAYMCSRAGGLGILPPMEGLKPLSCAISTEEYGRVLCSFVANSPKLLSSCAYCDHLSDTDGSLRTAL